MKHGSLFSGIGGFDLAAEWMGWENVFHCEIAEFPRKILNYYWPNAKTHEDITKTDFIVYRGTIDILTGGFPCQPFSAAGKRLGTEDSRHLWPEMLRAIREIKPRWILGENVGGFITWNDGMVFREVCSDLENEGYEVQAFIIPACATGAPHRRDRVWIVAYDNSQFWRERWEYKYGIKSRYRKSIQKDFNKWITSDSKNSRRKRQYFCRSWKIQFNRRIIKNVTYSNYKGLQRWENSKNIKRTERNRKQCDNFTGLFCSNFRHFPTQSPICSGDDGLPCELDGITFSKWRNESIKGYGNAVVPQVVYKIFQAIQNIDNELNKLG